MADTTFASDLNVDQWSAKYLREYVRASQLKPLMGKTPNAPIQLIEELGKKPGDDIWVPLVTRLSGSGVTGDSTLEGNEESLGNYGHKISVNQLRNAVRVGHFENTKGPLDLLEAARPMLKLWSMDTLRDAIIAAMLSPVVDGSTAYASATENQKNTWLAANSDRVLFGALRSNISSNVHATALGTVDSTADVLTGAIVSLAKRMAKAADRHIRPIRVDGQGEWFVMLCGSYPFRDLKSNLQTHLRDGMQRGKANPLFTDGDIVWDGVIIKEVPEIGVISGVGNGSIDVGASFLLGAQSVGLAWGERPHPIREVSDYGNLQGVGVAEIRGVEKLMHNSVQNMVTVYTAAVADA